MSSIGQERPAQRHARRWAGYRVGIAGREGKGRRKGGGSRGCTFLVKCQTRLSRRLQSSTDCQICLTVHDGDVGVSLIARGEGCDWGGDELVWVY